MQEQTSFVAAEELEDPALMSSENSTAYRLASSATASVSHAEAAAAMVEAHTAAATKAVEAATEEEGGVERCCILGCTEQLLRCNGKRQAGFAAGAASSSHIICALCLSRWYSSLAELREESGLPKQTRRTCPVCQTESIG